MLRSLTGLESYAIVAIDGPIGRVQEFLFADEAWIIRYLVVNTGLWVSSRKVLISPIAINQRNRTDKILPVNIRKEQVKRSPDIETDKPVSRQHEMRNLDHYEYADHWAGDCL